MTNRLLSAQRSAVIAFGLLLAAPVAAMAQDAAMLPASTLVVTAADGTETQYDVTDVAIYVSSSPAYDDVPASTSLSLTLTTITPIDAKLLEWAAQNTEDTKESRNVKVSVPVTGADGKSSDLVYEATDAHVSSFSATNSTIAAPSISLTLEATKLLINDVQMN